MRVRRVRKLERRGLRTARALARAGGCAGGSSAPGASGGGSSLASGGGSGLIPPPPVPERVGGGTTSSGDTSGDGGGGSPSGDGDSASSGDVRGESETQLPPPIDPGSGRRVEPGGLSLGIGVGLILLALLAGYATPHLRARLRSGRPA